MNSTMKAFLSAEILVLFHLPFIYNLLCFQSILEMLFGVGLLVGPPIGGFLYEVFYFVFSVMNLQETQIKAQYYQKCIFHKEENLFCFTSYILLLKMTCLQNIIHSQLLLSKCSVKVSMMNTCISSNLLCKVLIAEVILLTLYV